MAFERLAESQNFGTAAGVAAWWAFAAATRAVCGNRHCRRQHPHPGRLDDSLCSHRLDLPLEFAGDSARAGGDGAHAAIVAHPFCAARRMDAARAAPNRVDRGHVCPPVAGDLAGGRAAARRYFSCGVRLGRDSAFVHLYAATAAHTRIRANGGADSPAAMNTAIFDTTSRQRAATRKTMVTRERTFLIGAWALAMVSIVCSAAAMAAAPKTNFVLSGADPQLAVSVPLIYT